MIICVINQKGGVGKTTTAINLSVALAQWGQSTLLVDLDPQGNATSGAGVADVPSPTLYQCLVSASLLAASSAQGSATTGRAETVSAASRDEANALERGQGATKAASSSRVANSPAVAPGPVAGLGVVGAAAELAGSEVELGDNPRRDDLKRVLATLSPAYPLIVVDTPPSLSLLTVNALVAADRLIIPVQCEYFALEGLGQLLRTLERIKRRLNPDLSVLGLVRTMFDSRLGLNRDVSAELERHFSALVFKTPVPRNVRLAEAPSYGQPIALYDRRSPGADAYRRLAVETMERLGLSADHAPAASRGRAGVQRGKTPQTVVGSAPSPAADQNVSGSNLGGSSYDRG